VAGAVHIDLFSTLDGVMQAPGAPDEDPSGGFRFGGWQAPLADESTGDQIAAGIRSADALLLGRRTYDIFAGYWPDRVGRVWIADHFDSVPKYVASRGNPDLSWRGSHLLGRDLAAEVAALRERHESVHVIGSIDLARTLVAAGLFDLLNLWVHPIVVGPGKRLFPGDGPPTGLRLVEASPASEKGVLLLRYAPGGEVAVGEMGG